MMAFINALILSAAAHIFDSYYEETNDNESNSATVTNKMINDYFDYEY